MSVAIVTSSLTTLDTDSRVSDGNIGGYYSLQTRIRMDKLSRMYFYL